LNALPFFFPGAGLVYNCYSPSSPPCFPPSCLPLFFFPFQLVLDPVNDILPSPIFLFQISPRTRDFPDTPIPSLVPSDPFFSFAFSLPFPRPGAHNFGRSDLHLMCLGVFHSLHLGRCHSVDHSLVGFFSPNGLF